MDTLISSRPSLNARFSRPAGPAASEMRGTSSSSTIGGGGPTAGPLVGHDERPAQLLVGLIDVVCHGAHRLDPLVLDLVEDAEVDVLADELDVVDVREPLQVDVADLLEVLEDLQLLLDLVLQLLEPLVRHADRPTCRADAVGDDPQAVDPSGTEAGTVNSHVWTMVPVCSPIVENPDVRQ